MDRSDKIFCAKCPKIMASWLGDSKKQGYQDFSNSNQTTIEIFLIYIEVNFDEYKDFVPFWQDFPAPATWQQ